MGMGDLACERITQGNMLEAFMSAIFLAILSFIGRSRDPKTKSQSKSGKSLQTERHNPPTFL